MVKILEERDNIQRINEEDWLLLKKKKSILALTFAVSIFFIALSKPVNRKKKKEAKPVNRNWILCLVLLL